MGGCARRVSRQARSARKDELVQTGVCSTDWGRDSLPTPQGNEDEGLKLSSIVAASLRRRFRPRIASCAALMGPWVLPARVPAVGASRAQRHSTLHPLSAESIADAQYRLLWATRATRLAVPDSVHVCMHLTLG